MPYVDKVKSVKNTGVSQPRWAIWREIWKWSCIPSLLYCISRKNVDTEYMYYSWCMTSTDIVKWRKNEIMKILKKEWFIWKFWKKGGSREKGGGGNEIHAPCACGETGQCLSKVYKLRMLNWFSPGTSVSFTNKTDRHDITEILLKVALNTITITLTPS